MKKTLQAIAAFMIAFVFVVSFVYCAPLAVAELFIGVFTVIIYEHFTGKDREEEEMHKTGCDICGQHSGCEHDE